MENNNMNNNTDRTVEDVLAQMRRTAEENRASQNQPAQASTEAQPQPAPTRVEPQPAQPQPEEAPKLNESTKVETPFARYQSSSSSFAHASSQNEPQRETVYIDNSPKKKPKARLGVGAAAALVAACVVLSGGAGFAGAMLAGRVTNVTSESGTVTSSGKPSVIFQSYTNGNKTEGTYVQVADAVSPTVVEIVTESVATNSYMWGSSYVVSGAGSGVIISADGMIITNNHVVEGATNITVRMNDGTEYPATLIGTDSDSDIAVIKVEAKNLPFALIGNSDELKVGEEVVAVGNPLGEFGGSVTNGIISGLSRSVNIDGTEMTLIQTNAAVNPGNSGGGLFNLYGELIGIVNAKSSSSSSGTAVEGIGFAIPVNTASEVATELVNYGYVRGRVNIGITIVDIDNSWDAMNYRVSAFGVYVVSSEYEENELLSGDRIVAINDTAVEYSEDVKAAIKDYAVGDVVTVKVVRGGQYVDVPVTLHEYVPSTAAENCLSNNTTSFLSPETPAVML